jgi:superfamily I DNA/RNA helicase/RecB family exonuclease
MRRLDSHQQAAVDHGGGPGLVLAGPGSGKTTVIVERAVRLIDAGLARPEQLLVLTFSRKAASDLRERLASRLRRSYASFPVTTFHAFCLSILVRDAAEPPRLARAAERRAAMQAALAAEGNLGLAPTNALLDEALRFAELCDDYLEVPGNALARVRERYVDDLGALDYGGLQREAVALLESDEAIRRAYQDAFRYVLVDEYQDTNVAQERLLELIAGAHRNVFCVADEDQSIYGFRGAELENALGFEERWSGAVRYDLPTNYRSAPAVVELATDVIRRNIDTHLGKPLAAATERDALLASRTFRHAAEEADWIAREVAGLHLDGLPFGEVAVLARSLREIGPRLAYTFRRHGIPFHAPLAPQLHPTAEAVLSLLELAEPERWTPAHEDQALRTLASPVFAADPLELRRVRREPRTLYGALRDSQEFDELFRALGIVRRQRLAGNAVYALWEALPHFETLLRRDATREEVDELAALTALSDAANEFDADPAAFAAAFRHGELDRDELLPAEPLPADAVALLTIHQAKGLEWEAVLVCDLVEGRFPALARSQAALFDRDDFASRPLDETQRARRALEEERRLFYVAITRARSRLFLTATEEAREEAGRALSRFYLEAQPHLEEGRDREGFVSSAEAFAALRRNGGGPGGWRDRLETPNEHPMLAGRALWTSATRLGPYENCPLQFLCGSLLELARARTTQMALGGVFHDVLEAFHDPAEQGPLTLERLLQLAEDKWPAEGMGPAPLAAENRRLLDRLLRNYHESEIAPGLPDEVLAVERRFRFDLDGNATVTGYIDRIDRRPDGRLRLLDYKTSKNAMKKDEAEGDLQLALYALSCALVPELSELGEVAELVYLYPRALARGKLVRRGQQMTADLAERTRARVEDIAAAIRAEQFEFSPDADCQWCQFKQLCPRHHGQDVPL